MKKLKKLKRIRREILKARLNWARIEKMKKSATLNSLCIEKDALKNSIDEIGQLIENRLSKCNNKILRKKCVGLLREIFDLSVNLKKTYAFPVYDDCPTKLFDMIQSAER